MLLVVFAHAQDDVYYCNDELLRRFWITGELHNKGLDEVLGGLKATYGDQFKEEKTQEAQDKIFGVVNELGAGFTTKTLQVSGIDLLDFIRNSTFPKGKDAALSLPGQLTSLQSDAKYSAELLAALEALDAQMESGSELSEDNYRNLAAKQMPLIRNYFERVYWVMAVSTAYFSLKYWGSNMVYWVNFLNGGGSATQRTHPGKEIAKADVTGVIVGGAGGAIYGAIGGTATFPGVGTIVGAAGGGAAGAVVGGVTGSAKAAVSAFVGWVFGDR